MERKLHLIRLVILLILILLVRILNEKNKESCPVDYVEPRETFLT